MRLLNRWSTALCSGLVILAACDNSHSPLAPIPDGAAPAPVLAPSGLVAFYPMEGPTTGVLNGRFSHHPAGGYQGGAHQFDGVDDYMDIPVNVNPSAMPQMTMGAWVRTESLPTDGRSMQVLSNDNGGFDRSLGVDPRNTDSRYRYSAFTGTGVLSGAVAELNQWTFVAAVYTETSVTLYVNEQTFVAPARPGQGLDVLRVGGNPAGSATGEHFRGFIDNVFVYNRALTEAEVEQIRRGGACAITGACEPPRRVAFYPFDTDAGDGAVRGATHELAGGYQGGAYYFDGQDDYIDLPVNVNPSAMPHVTMGAWVRAASFPAVPSNRWANASTAGRPAALLSHDDGAFDRTLALDQRGSDGWWVVDGQYHVSAFSGGGILPGPIATEGAWTFVAAVYDGDSVALYVNGERFIRRGSPGQGVDFLRVGGNPLGSVSGEPFHGWIDNVFVVNRALSAAEIAEIRTEGACVLAGTACNVAPTATAGGPYRGAEGSPIALALSASDTDGDALSLSWDMGDGTRGTGDIPLSHVYANDGLYTVSITATDPAGLSSTASTTVQVTNVHPSVAPYAGALLMLGEAYMSAVTFSDPGVDGWTATVDYGDGSPVQPLVLNGKSARLAHAYTVPGTYTVRVTVRDEGAVPGIALATVTVMGLRDATTRIVGLVSEAAAAGQLTAAQAREITHQLTGAANFLYRADAATVSDQEKAMLRNALRDVEDALLILPVIGGTVDEVRADLLRVRTLLMARLGMIF